MITYWMDIDIYLWQTFLPEHLGTKCLQTLTFPIKCLIRLSMTSHLLVLIRYNHDSELLSSEQSQAYICNRITTWFRNEGTNMNEDICQMQHEIVRNIRNRHVLQN